MMIPTYNHLSRLSSFAFTYHSRILFSFVIFIAKVVISLDWLWSRLISCILGSLHVTLLLN